MSSSLTGKKFTQHQVFDSFPAAVLTLNEEDTILYANPPALRLLRTTKGNLIEKSFLRFISKDDIGAFKIARQNASANGSNQTCDIRISADRGDFSYIRLDLSGKETVVMLLTDITYKKKIENTQSFLLGNSWNSKGQDFFQALAEYLSDILNADYICIDRLHGNLEAETVAVYYDGHFEDNIRYTLLDTPCGKVLGSNLCSFPQSVRMLFPKDAFLQTMSAEGYTGITLMSAENKPIGLIAVISRKPVADVRTNEMILKQVSIRAAAELAHRIAERKFASLAKSNHAMLYSADEKEMMDKVCDIITKDCGYMLMWIGMARDDENKSIDPVASAGFEEGYLETLNLTWNDTLRGRGPTGTSIRTGKTYVCNNLLTDPNFRPWREEAIKRGYSSSIALPLRSAEKTFGAMMIYAREAGFFTPDEVKHLTELANDLAVGITAKRLESDISIAMEDLKLIKENLEMLVHERTCELRESNLKLTDEIRIRRENEILLFKAEEKYLETQRQLRALTQRIDEVAENERKRIASEIHDELGHLLTAIKFELDHLSQNPDITIKSLTNELNAANNLLDSLINAVRKIATDLRPDMLDHLGLIPSLKWQISQFSKRTRICCIPTMDDIEHQFNSKQTIVIYRILQEILTNIARHSGAKHVRVIVVEKEQRFVLKVIDDGCGFSTDDMKGTNSLGLVGMRERALSIGGEINIDSIKGTGTTVIFSLQFTNGKL